MFNVNKSQNNENSNNKKIKYDWIKFFSNEKKDELIESLAMENKFIQEEIKIKALVIDMLDREFGSNIRNIADYDFLVDSVVNKLKKKQLNSTVINTL